MMALSIMDRGEVERAIALYLPMCAAALGWVLTRPRGRVFAACLLGVLWSVPALLLLQRMNLAAGWWTYATDGPTMLAMPLELWFGWAVLWGVLPALALSRLPPIAQIALLAGFDAIMMPLCRASVQLHAWWLAGEIAALALVLWPSLMLQRWTMRGEHVGARAATQVLTAALVLLYLPAEMVFGTHQGSGGWSHALLWPIAGRQLLVQLGLLLALPGVSAVAEFASRGDGTPIPYDPPQRLVTSGIYRYIANPMQLSCLLTMLLWMVLLRSAGLLNGPLVCAVYCAGLARWDEAGDLRHRFGMPWVAYRACVRNWLPRWRPYVAHDVATLYIARGCGPCSAVRQWLQRRSPLGLRLADAESLPAGSITRMRYVDGEYEAEGVRAMARALEHLHLGWALAGAAIRLPGVAHTAQAFMDATGFGPQALVCDAPVPGGDAA